MRIQIMQVHNILFDNRRVSGFSGAESAVLGHGQVTKTSKDRAYERKREKPCVGNDRSGHEELRAGAAERSEIPGGDVAIMVVYDESIAFWKRMAKALYRRGGNGK